MRLNVLEKKFAALRLVRSVPSLPPSPFPFESFVKYALQMARARRAYEKFRWGGRGRNEDYC